MVPQITMKVQSDRFLLSTMIASIWAELTFPVNPPLSLFNRPLLRRLFPGRFIKIRTSGVKGGGLALRSVGARQASFCAWFPVTIVRPFS